MVSKSCQQLSLQVPAAGLGREQVHQEVGSSLGHQQQRAGGLHLQGPRQRGAGNLTLIIIIVAEPEPGHFGWSRFEGRTGFRLRLQLRLKRKNS